MEYIDNFLFAILLVFGIGFFIKNLKKLKRNINLGKDIDRSDRIGERWNNMFRIALGQSKMIRRPVSGVLHIIVYVGFVIINIEVLEIIIDGLFGTHRVLSFMGGFYSFLIASFEILAVLVLVAVIVFWIRRMIIRIPRFWNKEMKGFPKNDALYILYFEMVLMSLFLIMNATDVHFQELNSGNPVSQFVADLFNGFSLETNHLIERTSWWMHIAGILVFLNYLYYSKHLHILLAFPNTFFANLNPQGQFTNDKTVLKEVQMMMDPNTDAFAAPPEGEEDEVPEKFGASDVTDLNWVQLMNAYTCTECGRCTSVCPANQTGKELSPRAIMMKTRDRVEEVGNNIDQNGEFKEDGKQLLYDYIAPEELWACTSCNACVEECPIDIDPFFLFYLFYYVIFYTTRVINLETSSKLNPP